MRIAAVGELIDKPTIQGGGSAHIVPIYCDSLREELSKEFNDISFFKGYRLSGVYDKELIDETVKAAGQFDAVIFFAGCRENSELEGYDRKNLDIPYNQTRLLREIYKHNKNIIIVLSSGGVVNTGFDKFSKALLYCHLGGQAFGSALCDVLTGRVNPSGRLSETFPKRIEDLPSYIMFPGENGKAFYGEGIFVGYRYFDKKKIQVKYPFGYGLSYTDFEYSNLSVFRNGKEVHVSVDIKNCGIKDGHETVLLFVGKKQTNIIRAQKELRAFKKMFIKSGEVRRAEFLLNERDFSHYDTLHKKFMAEGGTYQILICKNAGNVVLKKDISYPPTRPSPLKLDRNMSIWRALKFEGGKEAIDEMILFFRQKSGSDFNPLKMSDSYSQLVTSTHPLRSLINFYEGKVTDKDLDDFIEEYNRRNNR